MLKISQTIITRSWTMRNDQHRPPRWDHRHHAQAARAQEPKCRRDKDNQKSPQFAREFQKRTLKPVSANLVEEIIEGGIEHAECHAKRQGGGGKEDEFT
jgi:hypothetical protein